MVRPLEQGLKAQWQNSKLNWPGKILKTSPPKLINYPKMK